MEPKLFIDSFALSRAARVGLLLVVMLVVCTLPGVALGQAADITPPVPTSPDKPPLIWNYIVFALIALLVLGSGLVPSKRGHQD